MPTVNDSTDSEFAALKRAFTAQAEVLNEGQKIKLHTFTALQSSKMGRLVGTGTQTTWSILDTASKVFTVRMHGSAQEVIERIAGYAADKAVKASPKI